MIHYYPNVKPGCIYLTFPMSAALTQRHAAVSDSISGTIEISNKIDFSMRLGGMVEHNLNR